MNFFKKLFATLGVLAVSMSAAFADIASDLETAASGALTAVATTTGTILVGAFAIAVGFKVYGLIKKALNRAG